MLSAILLWESSYDLVANMLDCDIVVNKFNLQSLCSLLDK